MFSSRSFRLGLLSTVLLSQALCVSAYESYANDFVDPDYILAKAWNSSTDASQTTIVEWASELAAMGPWSKRCSTLTT